MPEVNAGMYRGGWWCRRCSKQGDGWDPWITAWSTRWLLRCSAPLSLPVQAHVIQLPMNYSWLALTLYEHTKTAEQRALIQQYADWYTDRWWVGCYIWYSEEGPGRAAAPPSPLLAVPNVTPHQSTASVPASHDSMWHYNCLCTLKG